MAAIPPTRLVGSPLQPSSTLPKAERQLEPVQDARAIRRVPQVEPLTNVNCEVCLTNALACSLLGTQRFLKAHLCHPHIANPLAIPNAMTLARSVRQFSVNRYLVLALAPQRRVPPLQQKIPSQIAAKRNVQMIPNGQRVQLVIIGAEGAIGLPASYLAATQNLNVVMIDDGKAALHSSTHTVHTSIVRPNCAVWPFHKAVDSLLNGGPFDMRFSLAMVPFGFHNILQSYCISESRINDMWKSFRTLGMESREIYSSFDYKFGPITIGDKGRGHLSSPLVGGDNEAVLKLSKNLQAFGVESEIVTDSNEIQNYVGQLPVRHPEMMIRYPEDFVLDLQKYKSGVLETITQAGGIRLQDTVIGLETGSQGRVTAVLTKHGRRIQTEAVLYTGGWRANTFLKKTLGINLNSHLNIASGVRFLLPGHLANRSIVCGPMFLAPGHDESGTPVTDVGQMFLANISDPFPSQKHHAQALKCFHTYFNYHGDILRIWNCVGRPITTTGMPFIERVAPNMVVALGPGMFGVTVGAGLARRALDLLIHDKNHQDEGFFERRSGWDIISCFLHDKISAKLCVKQPRAPSHIARVIQIGKRGAMPQVLHDVLAPKYHYSVHGACEIEAVIRDIQTYPNAILVVASHGPDAQLPGHYDRDYLSADRMIERVLTDGECQNLSGIIVISGGIPSTVQHNLVLLAREKGVRFVHFPGLATSMEVLLNAVRSLLLKFENPVRIEVEETFHSAKKEAPSAGSSQLLYEITKIFSEERLMILVKDIHLQQKLSRIYRSANCKIVKSEDEIKGISRQFGHLIPVIIRSNRIDTPYRYQHCVTLQDSTFTVRIEQIVIDRAQLILPLLKVIEKLDSLPSSFSATNMQSVLPVTNFKSESSFSKTLSCIIDALARLGATTRIRSQDVLLERLIQSPLNQLFNEHLEYDQSLPFGLHIDAEIDGQLFLFCVSRTSACGHQYDK
jgi:glycine/D-amino acid oxidase-like deaminating enzyme